MKVSGCQAQSAGEFRSSFAGYMMIHGGPGEVMEKYGNLGSTWRLVGRRRLAARRRSGATQVVNATNAVQHVLQT